MRMHRLSAIVALSLSASAIAAPLTEESFTRDVLAQLQTAVPSHHFEYAKPLELHDATSADRSVGILYLDRIYQYARSNPPAADAAVRDYVSKVSGLIADHERPISREDLRLAVRNRMYIERSLAAMGPGPKAAFPRVLAGDLDVVPVIDSPTSVQYVGERALESLKLSQAEALSIAERNMRRLQKPLQQVARIPPSNTIGIINEEYAASRLIWPKDWADLAKSVGGNLVVMAPEYDTVIYGSGAMPIQVDALRTIGLNLAKQSQVPLSPTVFRLKQGHWEVVAPPTP